jgi:hypothetical protein
MPDPVDHRPLSPSLRDNLNQSSLQSKIPPYSPSLNTRSVQPRNSVWSQDVVGMILHDTISEAGSNATPCMQSPSHPVPISGFAQPSSDSLGSQESIISIGTSITPHAFRPRPRTSAAMALTSSSLSPSLASSPLAASPARRRSSRHTPERRSKRPRGGIIPTDQGVDQTLDPSCIPTTPASAPPLSLDFSPISVATAPIPQNNSLSVTSNAPHSLVPLAPPPDPHPSMLNTPTTPAPRARTRTTTGTKPKSSLRTKPAPIGASPTYPGDMALAPPLCDSSPAPHAYLPVPVALHAHTSQTTGIVDSPLHPHPQSTSRSQPHPQPSHTHPPTHTHTHGQPPQPLPASHWARDDFPWSTQLHELNRRVFGHGSFRPVQRETLNAIMAGRDAFALLPTGAGKVRPYFVASPFF